MSLARYIEQTNKHTSFTLGACSALFGIFYLYLFSGESLFKPDSLGYVDFSPIRSVGYPLFLKSVFFLWGSYTIIPFIQLFLFCCSAYFLSVSFFQISRSFPLSFLLLCALLGNVPFAQFSFFILTESITQSLLMLALALTIRAWNSRNKAYYGLCFVVGIATIVRPLFIVLAVLPFGLLFLQSSLKKLFSKPFFIGAFIIMFILSLGSAMQFFRYGFFKTESFLGYNLIGKV
ncbi:MAG: hypothetical protein EBZ47_09635, partial [Chlamydiae bacterium]|nr:hypothetical protein [Chlamydiota bacterium]